MLPLLIETEVGTYPVLMWFLSGCFYSAVSLTPLREWRFISTFYYFYYTFSTLWSFRPDEIEVIYAAGNSFNGHEYAKWCSKEKKKKEKKKKKKKKKKRGGGGGEKKKKRFRGGGAEGVSLA